MIHSYPSVVAIEHKLAKDIFSDNGLIVEEKIDGSQFSFGIYDGIVMCRSKGREQHEVPDEMFKLAVEQVLKRADILHDGWTYRCEYLQKPKHNTILYSRTPVDNLIGYDIMTDVLQEYLSPEVAKKEFQRIGLEFTRIFELEELNIDNLKNLLNETSILGGSKIEGVVIKDYNRFTPDKKPLMAKIVREEFKELNGIECNKTNPSDSDIITTIINRYKNEARWMKSVQHLRERGGITSSAADISVLLTEINTDIYNECQDEIKELLFDHFWKRIKRGVTDGFPEWYKEFLKKSEEQNVLE